MSADGGDFLELLKRIGGESVQQRALATGTNALASVTGDLDDRVNFRVNATLKAEFEKVCTQNHTTISREIKRFMTEVVRFQRVL